MLVAEFTLTENPANTTTSQLRTMCHADDSVILGTWLQETDHRTIEDQVIFYSYFKTFGLKWKICAVKALLADSSNKLSFLLHSVKLFHDIFFTSIIFSSCTSVSSDIRNGCKRGLGAKSHSN